jgi:hypothetical protein
MLLAILCQSFFRLSVAVQCEGDVDPDIRSGYWHEMLLKEPPALLINTP